MIESIFENGLNQGDKCQITLLDDTVLEVEFLQYVDYDTSSIRGSLPPYSSYISANATLNKKPYMYDKNGNVEFWQVDIKKIKIPIEEIKNICGC